MIQVSTDLEQLREETYCVLGVDGHANEETRQIILYRMQLCRRTDMLMPHDRLLSLQEKLLKRKE